MYSNRSFLAGSIVRIKNLNEILNTLDENDTLDGLPFMPEMAKLCGNEYTIEQRVNKTCIESHDFLFGKFISDDVVTLSDVRCNGSFHDECKRGCLIFWKTRWLEIVNQNEIDENTNKEELKDDIKFKTRLSNNTYFCQHTNLKKTTIPISKFTRIKVIFSDLRRKNYSVVDTFKNVFIPVYYKFKGKIRFGFWNKSKRSTPSESLGLNSGDLVEVKSYAEILRTLDSEGKNKGLRFTPDMKRNCGKSFLVRDKLDKMIDGSTGNMITLKNTVTLQNLTCGCHFPFGSCPRKEFNLWREIWLKKVES